MQQIPFIHLLNRPYMFRATNSPILRDTFDCILCMQLFYNATTLLPTGDTVEMELLLNRVTGRQQCWCTVSKTVYTVESVPEGGRICRPKHVGLI
jgi:hypothetical protein